MITTYLNNDELIRFKSVSDNDINDLLKEINHECNDKYRLQEKVFYTKKYFFSKPKKNVRYSLYTILCDSEVKCINFASESNYSINTCVSKSYILTYLYGILTGINELKK